MSQAQILVVDDEPDIRQLVQEILEDEGYSVAVAGDGESARLAHTQLKPDLVLLDIWMPDIDGISLLKEWAAIPGRASQVVIMSGHGTLETAVEATRLGAFDFVQKPLSLAKLLATVSKALATKPQTRDPAAETSLDEALEPLGGSPAMQLLRNRAKQAANHRLPVLISGEPGTDREMLARYIHRLSRAAEDFFILDHGRLADDDASTYLFGKANADSPVSGVLQRAAGGTLFIPELQKIAERTQQLLADVLAAGHFTPAGDTNPRPLECRIISSAADNVEQLVSAGRILDALYLRLNVLPLRIAPLRERPEDIPDLVRFYCDWFPNQQNLPYRSFPVAVQNRMRNHDWPGNVRELRNLVQHLLVLGGEGDVSVQEVEQAMRSSGVAPGPSGENRQGLFDKPLREAREQFERDYLIYQLKKAGGSVGKLSESVGMERTHLYRKLRSLGINPRTVTRTEDK